MPGQHNGSNGGERTYGQNFKKFGLDLNLFVSLASGLAVIAFCLIDIINLERVLELLTAVQDFITARLDWIFITASNFIVLACVYIAFYRLGSVRIGGARCEKEFGNFA